MPLPSTGNLSMTPPVMANFHLYRVLYTGRNYHIGRRLLIRDIVTLVRSLRVPQPITIPTSTVPVSHGYPASVWIPLWNHCGFKRRGIPSSCIPGAPAAFLNFDF